LVKFQVFKDGIPRRAAGKRNKVFDYYLSRSYNYPHLGRSSTLPISTASRLKCFPVFLLLALSAAHAQGWQKIYPADANPRDAVLMGWDNQNRIFLWDAASPAPGVYYSTNSGSTWLHETLDAGLALTSFVSFAVSPNGTLYALANVLAPQSWGVYKSVDLGKNWTKIHDKPDRNLNSPPPVVQADNDLFFYGRPSTSTSVNGWLYRSATAGTNWDSTAQTLRNCQQMSIDPTGKIYLVCTSDGDANFRPWVLIDGGTSFTPYRISTGGVGGGCSYSLNTDVTGTLLAGCSNNTVGMAVNGTDTLVLSQFNNSGGDVTGVAARSATEFFAAGNNVGVFRSTNAGTAWNRFGQGMTGSDSAQVRKMQRGPDGRVYAATSGFVYAYGTPTAIRNAANVSNSLQQIRVTSSGWEILPANRSTFGVFRILDSEGKLLREVREISNGRTYLTASGLPRGILFLEIGSGPNRRHFRLPPIL
jgi:hypothetical protein